MKCVVRLLYIDRKGEFVWSGSYMAHNAKLFYSNIPVLDEQGVQIYNNFYLLVQQIGLVFDKLRFSAQIIVLLLA